MKIRNGFVSNSSTTSFCIYGVTSDEEIYDDDDYKTYQKLMKLGISLFREPDSGTSYAGVSFSTIKDDETGKQFKERVEKILKEHLGKKIEGLEFGIQEGGWRDG